MPLTRGHETLSRQAAERNAYIVNEVRWFLKSNAGWGPFLKQMGYSADALCRLLYRVGEHELARQLASVTQTKQTRTNRKRSRK
jgi:hypothetical protein